MDTSIFMAESPKILRMMFTKRITLITILVTIFFSCKTEEKTSKKNASLAQKVNPFIGTGGHGHTYPGASAPFGGVQLSPDTRLEGWDGCGGYHYSDSIIYGFSHTHLSGTGVSDYGDILFMPITGEPKFDNGYKTSPDSGYASRFSHESEVAEAGYYKINLSDYNIDVELTATERCGFQKYKYHNNEFSGLILDLKHRDELLDFKIEIIDSLSIQGKRISKAWATEQHVYFYSKLKKPIESIIFNSDSSVIYLKTNYVDEQQIKTGISSVSIEGAKKNLEQEIPHWDFEKTKSETQEKWNKELSKIEVEMLSSEDEEVFYTSLYHSFLNPNIFQDVNGKYRGTDLEIHQADSFTNYTIFSLWDTYRATHPLFTITQREKTLDFINTFLNQYKNGGKLPVWELAGNYTGCMIGYHSIPVIVDAYLKGITEFDAELAFEAMIKTSIADELGKPFYIKNGYAAADEEHESVSKNLEYAYDDWCIAQFAKSLGKDDIYKEYIERAQNYNNIFEPKTGFMRAKRNQQFLEPFNPTEVNFNFTEANSWQYSFYVPQDISGLINLYGGPNKFESKLDELFTTTNKTSGRHQVDITGLIGQYAHGNEPSHHMAYLYNYVDKPSKTQEKVRYILDEMYSANPDGLIGNEDCGQMSSWYIFSALGFYPVTPGSTGYIIGSPKIKSAKINLENGKTFEIEAKNQSKENIYIKSIQLNGKNYSKSFITHQDIMNGGKLIFEMSNQPNNDLESPVSSINENLITPVPYVIADGQVFFDSLKLELSCVDKDADIYYTLDETEPNTNSKKYSKPIIITENTELKAFAISKGKRRSKQIHSKYYKNNNRRKVSYNQLYNPQYSAGGEQGLVDNLRGGHDFRTGTWQGFQGHDIEIIVDLMEEQTVTKISSGYIQDINSWIWMPKTVTYSISLDGKKWIKFNPIKTKTPTDEYGSILDEFTINFYPKEARYIKLEATQFGEIPEWHLGKGGQSFIFIDEIIIE